MVQIKICGVRKPETLQLLEELGVEFAGFVFHPSSPRNISFEEAKWLSNYSLKKVAVVVNPDDKLLENIMHSLRPDFIQLHGDETVERVCEIQEKFGINLVKAVAVSGTKDVDKAMTFEGVADYLLFDAKLEGAGDYGGLGKCFDWAVLRRLDIHTPWFLAGGINVDNVVNATKISGAKMVDISSGVEQLPGIKNHEKIREFVKVVKSLSPHNL